MIHHNLIFCFDPAVSVADEIMEEDNIPIDVGDNIDLDFSYQLSATSPKCWDDVWLDLKEEAADMEG